MHAGALRLVNICTEIASIWLAEQVFLIDLTRGSLAHRIRRAEAPGLSESIAARRSLGRTGHVPGNGLLRSEGPGFRCRSAVRLFGRNPHLCGEAFFCLIGQNARIEKMNVTESLKAELTVSRKSDEIRGFDCGTGIASSVAIEGKQAIFSAPGHCSVRERAI